MTCLLICYEVVITVVVCLRSRGYGVDVLLMLKCCLGRQANEEGEESQSKKALEESKQQIAKLQKGL